MSLTSTITCCIAIALVSSVLLPFTVAVPTPHDRDRAILAFNEATDRCRELNDSSHREDVNAANWACWRAFVTLDEINSNSCRWRNAGCQAVTGQPHKQCACTISMCTEQGIRSDLTRTFRECAVGLWPDESNVQALHPSARFQRSSLRVENDLQAFRLARKSSNVGSSHGASTSYTGNSGTGGLYSDIPQVGSGLLQEADFVSGFADKVAHCASTSGGSVKYKGDLVLKLSQPRPKSIFCRTCGRGYTSNRSYNQHIRVHASDSATCKFCNRLFSSKSNYNWHMKSQHGQESTPSAMPSYKTGAGGKTFGCTLCRREYKNAKLLRDHHKSHTQLLICKACLKSYSARTNFDKHIKKAHPRYEEVAARVSDAEVLRKYYEANPYPCDVCNAQFSSEKSRRQHMTSHLTQATTCTVCNKKLSTVSSFNYHMKTQHKGSASASGTSGTGENNNP